MKKSIKNKVVLPMVLGTIILTSTGCIKPYNEPKFVEIQPNQTAFVIPLEGKTSEQGQFQSEKFLQESMVATKRIEVPKTWVQTGRMSHKGEYKDTVRVIVVDRTPVNREWFNDAERSSNGKSQGFIGESKDSIKFKIGMTATAKIEEKDTAKFLYQYSGKDLATVMDTEIRNKLGTLLLEQYGTMTMTEIRENKAEVIEHVRKEATPYFKNFGITLQNIGYVGDLEYVDPNVQKAINDAFNARQQQEAQEIRNQTEIEKARAEKQAIEERQATLTQSLKLKELEIQQQMVEKWDGSLPKVSSGSESGMMLNIGDLDK